MEGQDFFAKELLRDATSLGDPTTLWNFINLEGRQKGELSYAALSCPSRAHCYSSILVNLKVISESLLFCERPGFWNSLYSIYEPKMQSESFCLIFTTFALVLYCRRVLTVKTADEFYSAMGQFSQEMLTFSSTDSNRLIKVNRGQAAQRP